MKRALRLTGPDDPRRGKYSHGTYSTYSNHDCRCQPCRDAWAAYVVDRRSRSVPPPAGDPRHGTPNCYHNFRCRCHACTEANRADKADRRHRAEAPNGQG